MRCTCCLHAALRRPWQPRPLNCHPATPPCCCSLAAALQGVLHRDIKPENIMLGGDGDIKVRGSVYGTYIDLHVYFTRVQAKLLVNITSPSLQLLVTFTATSYSALQAGCLLYAASCFAFLPASACRCRWATSGLPSMSPGGQAGSGSELHAVGDAGWAACICLTHGTEAPSMLEKQ